MHIDRPVAAAREAEAEAKIGAVGLADQLGEGFDLIHLETGDRCRPLRRAAFEMGFELARCVGVALHIVPIRMAVAKQHMHHCTGQSAVRAGTETEMHISLARRGVEIGIDNDDFGAARFACLNGMAHDVHLRRRRVGAPNDDQVRFRHFARIDALQLAGAGLETEPRHIDADGGVELGITLGVAQAVDAVAHQKAHGAGKIIRPHRLGTKALFGFKKGFGHFIERRLPANRAEFAVALGAAALQRLP